MSTLSDAPAGLSKSTKGLGISNPNLLKNRALSDATLLKGQVTNTSQSQKNSMKQINPNIKKPISKPLKSNKTPILLQVTPKTKQEPPKSTIDTLEFGSMSETYFRNQPLDTSSQQAKDLFSTVSKTPNYDWLYDPQQFCSTPKNNNFQRDKFGRRI